MAEDERTGDEADEERLDDELAPLSDEGALRRRVERQVKKRSEFRSHVIAFVAVNAVLTALFMGLGIPWVAGIVALAWGAGLAADAIDTYSKTGKRAALRTARVHQAFRDEYGPRWYETASQKQLRETLKRVEKPFTERREFYTHLAAFVGINAMLWWIWASVMLGGFPWPLFVTGFWGIGLFSDAAETFTSSRRQTSIEREVERQRQLMEEAQWGGEKPKNDFRDLEEDGPAMQVGPDGELIDFVEDDEAREKQKRR
jgi:hypothetical protein